MKNDNNLIWIDLEMTGLDPLKNKILEIATIVTDPELNILAEGPVLALFQSNDELKLMDTWNTHQHNQSGLIERVQASTVDELQAETLTIDFLQQWITAGKSPMCGNSICLDRRFLHQYMPNLVAYFHYRNLDVSTIKELVKRWQPHLLNKMHKESKHLAIYDIRDSIAELIYYRQHFMH